MLRFTLSGEAEIEIHYQLIGNHIVRACAGMNIGDLETGGLEVFIALIPFGFNQLLDRRSSDMNWIFTKMGVGDMRLNTFDPQLA